MHRALKNFGRPLKFETPADMHNAIQEYFDETPDEEITITGLAISIGSTRQGLTDYMKRAGYGKMIRQAKLIVENAYERALRKQGRSGDIFALKNFGWTDKHVTEIQGGLDITAIDRRIIEASDSE